MTTFDEWEVMVRPPENSLMHFRTKGSKNGIRRYQTPSGEWTELGLAERRKREGWGESRRGKRLQKQIARRDRRVAKQAARTQAKEKRREERAKRNVKNLSDAELRKRIERLKMEEEYRSLNKNPIIETGAKLINGYLKMKSDKLDREERRYKLINDRQNAKSNLTRAKAQKMEALNTRIDMFIPATTAKRKARAELLKAKNDRSKNTVRGAISSTLGNIVRKEGNAIVKSMPENSMIISGAKKAAGAAKKAGTAVRNAVDVNDKYIKTKINEKKKKKAPNNPFKG